MARGLRCLKMWAARTGATAPVAVATGRMAQGEQYAASGRSALAVVNLACFGTSETDADADADTDADTNADNNGEDGCGCNTVGQPRSNLSTVKIVNFLL